tara:strand:+ start:319 stop:501 length:183 start_codon:yes stop_codon:yes gene_type:complete
MALAIVTTVLILRAKALGLYELYQGWSKQPKAKRQNKNWMKFSRVEMHQRPKRKIDRLPC